MCSFLSWTASLDPQPSYPGLMYRFSNKHVSYLSYKGRLLSLFPDTMRGTGSERNALLHSASLSLHPVQPQQGSATHELFCVILIRHLHAFRISSRLKLVTTVIEQ